MKTKEKKSITEEVKTMISENNSCEAAEAEVPAKKCGRCSKSNSEAAIFDLHITTDCSTCANYPICKFVDTVSENLEALSKVCKPEILKYEISCKYYRSKPATIPRPSQHTIKDTFFGDKYQPSRTGITIKHIRHPEEEES